MTDQLSEAPSAVIHRLLAEKEGNPGKPPGVPSRLPLSDIYVEPEAFQVRAEGLVEDRVAEIARGVDGSNLDEPIHVWWTGLRWVVIEGHHRHAAYSKREEQTGETIQVPVVAHPDLPYWKAQGIAAQLNDREKIRISKAEMLNNAWRMVCLGEGSIKQQSKHSGVSKSQISNMRAAKLTLASRKIATAQMFDAGWKQCREWANGKSQRDHGPDALEAMAQEMAEELKQIKVTTVIKSPDVFARAIQILSPALPDRLLEAEPFWDALNTTGRQILNETDQEFQQEDQTSAGVEDF